MGSFEEEAFPQLVELIYDAAIDPARWPRFLDALIAPFGGANGILHSFNRRTNELGFVLNFGTDPSYQASFLNHYCHINPYAKDSARVEVGKIVPASEAVSIEVIQRSTFYNEWMRPQGIPPDHFGVRLFDDGAEHVMLGVSPHISRFARHRDRYEQQLARLIPHLLRAVQINKLTAKGRADERLVDDLLDAWTAAVLVLDGRGNLVRANRRADAMLSTGVLGTSRDWTLCVDRSDEKVALEAAVVRVLKLRSHSAAGPLRLTLAPDGRVHVAWVVSCGMQGNDSENPRTELLGDNARPAVLIMISPVRQSETIPADVIQSVFGLTPAEARLAAMLISGRSLQDYATEAGLSRNTVRNQLSNVFAKTGTSRQAELVGLITRTLSRDLGA